jgi:hypothetical protein
MIVVEGNGAKREYRFKLEQTPSEKKIDLIPIGGDRQGQQPST